jgi:hypothetical protein
MLFPMPACQRSSYELGQAGIHLFDPCAFIVKDEYGYKCVWFGITHILTYTHAHTQWATTLKLRTIKVCWTWPRPKEALESPGRK